MANDPTKRFLTASQMLTLAGEMKTKFTNQNAFSNFTVGESTISAGTATDTFEIEAGSNITLTPGTKKVTIAATDTTYSDAVASVAGEGGTSGLFTGVEKEKLAGIATGAEVNQNAFSKVKVGNVEVEADTKTDTLEIEAGTNVSITPDANGDKITIAATDTTYSAAVPSVSGEGGTDGLITAADQEKLNGIAAGSQVNVIEEVQVAGTALPISNKAVNIAVATGDSGVGTFKIAGTQYTVYGLGDAAAAGLASNGVADGETGLVTGDEVNDAIAAAVAATYKPAGSLAPAGVVSSLLVAANEGKVYNLSAALTLDATSAALFVDGTSGESFPEGTNIVIVDTDDTGNSPTFKFDVLAGFVDLSPFQVASDLGGLTTDEMNAIIAAL